jgi:hypothetical protein
VRFSVRAWEKAAGGRRKEKGEEKKEKEGKEEKKEKNMENFQKIKDNLWSWSKIIFVQKKLYV